MTKAFPQPNDGYLYNLNGTRINNMTRADMAEHLHEIGIHDAFNEVLKLIEQDKPDEAHAHLDQLINPKFRSRASHLATTKANRALDEATSLHEALIDAACMALPYVEEAQGDPAYKKGRVANDVRKLRGALQAVGVA